MRSFLFVLSAVSLMGSGWALGAPSNVEFSRPPLDLPPPSIQEQPRFDQGSARLLAKKKKGKGKKRGNKKGRTKVIKTNPNPIRIGQSGASPSKQLGSKGKANLKYLGRSNDLDPSTLKYRAQLQADRLPDPGSEKKYIQKLEEHLFYGGDLNAVDAGGNTYLHHAVLKDRREIAKFLVEKGINTELKNLSGLTAAALAEQMKLAAMSQILRAR